MLYTYNFFCLIVQEKDKLLHDMEEKEKKLQKEKELKEALGKKIQVRSLYWAWKPIRLVVSHQGPLSGKTLNSRNRLSFACLISVGDLKFSKKPAPVSLFTDKVWCLSMYLFVFLTLPYVIIFGSGIDRIWLCRVKMFNWGYSSDVLKVVLWG